jgi:hypothetical protein
MKHIGLGIVFCVSLCVFAAEEIVTDVVEQEEVVSPQPDSEEQTEQETETAPEEEVQQETSKDELVTPTTTEELPESLQPEQTAVVEITEKIIPQTEIVTAPDQEPTVEQVVKPVPVIDTVLPSTEEMALDQAPFMPTEIKADDFETAEIEEAHIAGVDTVSLEEGQGNWLFKRMWWERAQETYQKLKTHLDKILELRSAFFSRRSVLDKELFDVFYLTLGMGISEFTTVLKELRNWVSSERPEGEELSTEKQHVLDTLKMEQETIESVVVNVDLLKQIDNAIENSLGIIIESINSARRFEREGWEYFKEIGLILSEKKARELFYKLDVALQNVKQLSGYLEKPFSAYFAKLEDRARQTVSVLQSQLAMLKEKQINLKEKVDELNRKIDTQEQEKIEELEEEIVKKPTSWWGSITDSISSFFRTIRSLLPW